MNFATVLFVAGGLWICVLGLFMALCRAAKLGDEALMRAVVTDSVAPGRRKARPLRVVGGRTAGVPSGPR